MEVESVRLRNPLQGRLELPRTQPVAAFHLAFNALAQPAPQ